MTNNNHKPIISICPFQTQLVVQIPITRDHVATRAMPSPQILKVQCDREKCQLWDGSESVCAVSAITGIEERLVELTDVLSCSFGDLNDTLKHFAISLVNLLKDQ